MRKTLIGKDEEFLFSQLGYDKESLTERKKNFDIAVNEEKRVRFTEKLTNLDTGKIQYFTRYYQPLYTKGRISGISTTTENQG